jgi:hypothetical protein
MRQNRFESTLNPFPLTFSTPPESWFHVSRQSVVSRVGRNGFSGQPRLSITSPRWSPTGRRRAIQCHSMQRCPPARGRLSTSQDIRAVEVAILGWHSRHDSSPHASSNASAINAGWFAHHVVRPLLHTMQDERTRKTGVATRYGPKSVYAPSIPKVAGVQRMPLRREDQRARDRWRAGGQREVDNRARLAWLRPRDVLALRSSATRAVLLRAANGRCRKSAPTSATC